METAEYHLMTCEYAIWNAAIASLQFWAEDPDPFTLGISLECIYTTFFWTPTSHTLHQLSEDVLFGCFVNALNAAFTQQLSLADEGYKSGSNTADLCTPLWKTPHIHHIVCCLSFTSDSSEDDQDPDSTPVHSDEERISKQYL